MFMSIRTFTSCLLVFALLVGYKEFPKSYYKTPDYITKATGKNLDYFKAYDDVLSIWDVDYEEIYVPTTYGTAHVIVSGPEDGDPLVLLHGMTASSTMWYPNAKALAKNHRIYAIDLIIEPGKSHLTKEINDVDYLLAWYHELFNTLKLKDFSLIGVSRGGWIATGIALQKQDNIKSLILLSPAQTLIWIPPSQDLLKNIIFQFSSDEKKMRQTFESMSYDPSKIDERYLKQNYLGSQLDSINKFVISMQPFNDEELSAIKVPTLLLIGDDDIINNEKSIRFAKKTFPNVSTKVIPQAGHFLSVDQPEKVNQAILDFLGSLDH